MRFGLRQFEIERLQALPRSEHDPIEPRFLRPPKLMRAAGRGQFASQRLGGLTAAELSYDQNIGMGAGEIRVKLVDTG